MGRDELPGPTHEVVVLVQAPSRFDDRGPSIEGHLQQGAADEPKERQARRELTVTMIGLDQDPPATVVAVDVADIQTRLVVVERRGTYVIVWKPGVSTDGRPGVSADGRLPGPG